MICPRVCPLGLWMDGPWAWLEHHRVLNTFLCPVWKEVMTVMQASKPSPLRQRSAATVFPLRDERNR